MSRITDALTAPQTARAKMRAGSGFEAESSVTVTPVGLLAIGGLVAAILLSAAPLVRAKRWRRARVDAPPAPGEPAEMRQLPAPARTEER